MSDSRADFDKWLSSAITPPESITEYAWMAWQASRAQPERKLTDAELEVIALKCMNYEEARFDIRKFLELAAQPAAAPACKGCRGEGQVGGLRQDGYDSEECPFCKGTGIEQPAAATVPDEATISQTFKPRELVTLNGVQVKDLLDAVTGENGPDPETEITLIAHDTPFKSTDGEDMPAGTYFYWTEYPEEGIVLLDGTEQPPAAQIQDDANAA